MATGFRAESARIYEFPLKRRLAGALPTEAGRLAADTRLRAEPGIVSGSGWYHEAAIQDAERTRRP